MLVGYGYISCIIREKGDELIATRRENDDWI
jgi:hypothetical protein